MLPHRHGGSITDLPKLKPLPSGEWDGEIAYLDRDGVLNIGRSDYVNSVDELVVLEGAAAAVGRIRRSGYRVVIVTNQSPIGRGLWDHDRLAEIHDTLQAKLLEEDGDAFLDLVLYSPYAPWEGSWARKGNPGMLEVGRQLVEACEAGHQEIELDYKNRYQPREEGSSFMVGDRDADMFAGSRHGVRTFRCDADIGIAGVVDRVLDSSDQGDMA